MSYHLTNCVPMLETNDLPSTISFYSHTLGFRCIGMYPDAGHPIWVTMKRDSAEIMFASHTNVHDEAVATKQTTMTGSIYLYPTDVDAVWDDLKESTEVEIPIKNFDYGVRGFAIRDCNGYLIHFGKPIAAD